jgi:hypothetical protein
VIVVGWIGFAFVCLTIIAIVTTMVAVLVELIADTVKGDG